jgi:TetR/AcrR family transcriptional regulator, mexCD-oprJ operon repressor
MVLPAMPQPTVDHRRAVAERNVEAILDAAERLLEGRGAASIASVASEAGVSRVTVYAHFPTREALLEAVVERAVGRAIASIEAAEPEAGPAGEALARVTAACWRELERHAAIVRASSDQLTARARRRGHETGFLPIRRLVERGQETGAFRTDVSADWLVAVFYALIHGAADEVRAGRSDSDEALSALTVTLRDAFHTAALTS